METLGPHLLTHHLFLFNTQLSLAPHCHPQVPLSAKMSKPGKAAMHGNGNPGEGMKGHQPATPSLYIAVYAVMSYEEIALKKLIPVGMSLRKARHPL